jgi:hypothetical protein
MRVCECASGKDSSSLLQQTFCVRRRIPSGAGWRASDATRRLGLETGRSYLNGYAGASEWTPTRRLGLETGRSYRNGYAGATELASTRRLGLETGRSYRNGYAGATELTHEKRT